MYVCGPTVYDRAHLGNARPVVVFDTLFRLLRHVYGADHVTYVRNFTDVDDKINAEALRRRDAGAPGTLEELINERTKETIGWYHADMDALGALRPDREPRATQHIGRLNSKTGRYSGMIGMIQKIIDRHGAYVVSDGSNENPKGYVVFDTATSHGHVLFDVNAPTIEYGGFSGRSVEDMIAGARAETAPFKRNPADFVLWKPSSDDLPGWNSPWGRGRPGWHIECSAMSSSILGANFDIHGGGLDLRFPHHENEIAQSRCAHPRSSFARYWLHNEMLLVDGKKMSKSLGNFFTVRDLLDQGVSGEVIRFVLLGTHYSKPMDWTRRKAMEAKSALMEMALMLGSGGEAALASLKPGKPLPEVVDALADDLNTHLALSLLRRKSFASRYTAKERMDLLEDLYASQQLLGFDLKKAAIAMSAGQTFDGILGIVREIAGDGPAKAIARRIDEARNRKDFAEADRLRSGLEEAGVIVKSTKEGTLVEIGLNFDPAKLEALE
jgi:cysteinyl-tRNA synthetase